MNYNNILILILFLSSTATIITNGVLMINERDNLNFSNLTPDNKGYVFCLIYNEIYLFIILIYNIIYYFYYCLFSCFINGELQFNYNCWKALFFISGIISHIYLLVYLIIQKNKIDDNINNINIIFTVNFLFTIVITIIFNILKKRNNNYLNLV